MVKTIKTNEHSKRNKSNECKTSSIKSDLSLGIGCVNQDIVRQRIDKMQQKIPAKSDSTEMIAKLQPEGSYTLDDDVDCKIIDCIAYLIYCPKHDRIAVTNVSKLNCIWFPFVSLPEGITWLKASHNGLQLLIGRQDPEQSATEAELTAPRYSMSYLHILNLIVSKKLNAIRIIQFVFLKHNPNFNCCENTIRVNWLPTEDIFNNKDIDKLWGPELKLFGNLIKDHLKSDKLLGDEFSGNNEFLQMEEITFTDILTHLYRNKDTNEYEALQCLGIENNKLASIFEHFCQHCFPSFFMCYQSFHSYFIINIFNNQNNSRNTSTIQAWFRAFSYENEYFVDFYQFLIGIIAIDPKCETRLKARLNFIFR